ncbi:unnamed protein product, partial [Oncorhynchus mykiss]
SPSQRQDFCIASLCPVDNQPAFLYSVSATLGGLFSQILQGEDIVRERAIKFLSIKLKTMPEDAMTKEVEDYIFTETKKVLEDVTGEEFVLLMRILMVLKGLQTMSGRQQLVELVVEQAFLEQALNPADPDTVDRLLQCTRQALPLFSKNVHSTRFVTYFCDHVLPNLSSLTSPVAELDIQLEVLKLLAEMSPFCGDMEKVETNLTMLFEKLLVSNSLAQLSLLMRLGVLSPYWYLSGYLLMGLGEFSPDCISLYLVVDFGPAYVTVWFIRLVKGQWTKQTVPWYEADVGYGVFCP